MAKERLRVVESLAGVPATAWNALCGEDPFTRHEFLSALIDTGCAVPRKGWRPQLVLLESGEAGHALAGAMPLFLKSHSYGEYVFDWAWADAYQRHGLEYYPKLLCAVPFTPVTGPRLLAPSAAARATLARAALEMAREVSSLHVLFPPEAEATLLEGAGMMLRRTVQFHWQNAQEGGGYADFEDFLSRLTAHRRKVIRQERRRVRDAGVTVRWLCGAEIARKDWEFFERCYRRTYAEHRSSPYLNLEFFLRLGATLPEYTVMFIAERDGQPIAATLNLATDKTIFGRYWGALQHVPLLHFEMCYYQTIEYAIARRLQAFEGGAQGEHKLFRGLLPVETHSAHWLAHPSFASAIEDYLSRERAGIARYVDELNEHSPFRSQAGSPPP
jgi:predicted N-acyltransferase